MIANALSQIDELPDFSDDGKIAVMSDFGGEHPGAHFNTYSFLFLSYNKVGPIMEKLKALREKHNLVEPYSEFAYKRLRSGARSRALPEFLNLVDNFIHGALITLVIDRNIASVFGSSKTEAHAFIEKELLASGFGKWTGASGEKALRICHSIAIFASVMTHANQRLLWYCDNDTINENGVERHFEHTQKLFAHILGMYSPHTFEIVGFAKSFDDKSHLDDLLSVPDLAAGVVQDILQGHRTGQDIPGGDEKIAVIKWISSPAKFLSKITVQIAKLSDGQLGSGLIAITPKSEE